MIQKASGELEAFDPWKIRRAVLRSGASDELATQILQKLEGKLYEGITTKEIFDIVHQLLHSEHPAIASRYDLKGAIMRLGPDGFAFETYVSEVLREYGYKTSVRQMVTGVCVKHEIDIIAEHPDGKTSAIECKYHNSKGLNTGLKEAMYTYARLLDLREGCQQGHCQRFDDIWLVTNTKFSPDAIQYAQCKELRLLGWRHPPENTLENMIESKGLYPVTILKSLDKKARDRLFGANLMLAKDLLTYDLSYLSKQTGIPRSKLNQLVSEAEHFYGR